MHRKQFMRFALASLGTILCVGGLNSSSVANQNLKSSQVFRDTTLAKHNTYRATHHSPAMTNSGALLSSAQSYAETILATGNFTHSSREQRNGAGENLYVKYSSAPLDPADIAAEAVEAWYAEESDYDYNNPGFSGSTGHFTQVVWKSSTELGCGVAQGPATLQGRTWTANYVVCHYAPAGNFQGQFPANVLQP